MLTVSSSLAKQPPTRQLPNELKDIMNIDTLRVRFEAERAAGKRAKEAAETMGVSEGEAVAAHCGEHDMGPKARALRTDWLELLQALQPCGPLMALTRNESTVHEKTGIYQRVSATGHVGLVLGEDIDLRLFFHQWHAGFAVTELAANPGNRARQSLQFFDAHGKAVHKIFPRENTDFSAWDAVADAFSAPDLAPVFRAKSMPAPIRLDEACDAQALGAAWAGMRDTHEFFGLLKTHGVERQQSFRLVEGRFTRRMAAQSVRVMLHEAAFDGTPIMCFVGSPGCIQIHTGPVRRIEPMEIRGVRWLNVLDPGFTLHLREDSIPHVWVVEKPTVDGVVTSLEAFDRDGELMAMFFGVRKPGQPEKQVWRDTVAKLPAVQQAAKVAP